MSKPYFVLAAIDSRVKFRGLAEFSRWPSLRELDFTPQYRAISNIAYGEIRGEFLHGGVGVPVFGEREWEEEKKTSGLYQTFLRRWASGQGFKGLPNPAYCRISGDLGESHTGDTSKEK